MPVPIDWIKHLIEAFYRTPMFIPWESATPGSLCDFGGKKPNKAICSLATANLASRESFSYSANFWLQPVSTS